MPEWIKYGIFGLGIVVLAVFTVLMMVQNFQLQLLELRFRRQFANKDYQAALDTIERALRLNPTGSVYYHQRGRIHAEMGDLSLAEADYTYGMKFAHGATAYAGRAAVRLSMGSTKEALIDANHAIACNRLWWRGYFERGRVYATLGHYNIALDDFEQALELNSNPEPELYLARAEVAMQLGDLEAAARDRQRAREIYAKIPQANLKL